jgi:Big-like domain-containing protein
VSATSTSITPTQTITLTATVAPAVSGTPTGTVTFFDNGTHLGSPVELTGSAAQLVVPGLLSGQHSITAVYGGDPNFSASTSAVAATVTVSTPDFTLNGLSVQSQNVIPGGVASYGFALAPLAGVYPAVVTFSVSGLPPGATASFSPASLSVNAGAQTVTLTVRTTATTAWTIAPSIGSRLATTSLALLLVPLFGASRMRRRGRKPGPWLCLLLLAGMATTLLSGCGGGGFAQSPKSYPLTITATSGALQHTTSITLNEQ